MLDFIYDYTFLCALEPAVRGEWADKMKSLLAPGGELLTLIFPICDKVRGQNVDVIYAFSNYRLLFAAQPDGPPYAMSIELVSDLLLSHGFEAIHTEMLPSELCHPGMLEL